MLDNNRDRGRIKWTAMMLPEHIEKLREWQEEDNLVERPELNDFDLELIQEEIEIALRRKCQTQLHTWIDGKVTSYLGIIEEINLQSRIIVLEDPFGIERIAVKDIISVNNIN